jgi:hypothetical protein
MLYTQLDAMLQVQLAMYPATLSATQADGEVHSMKYNTDLMGE